MRSATAGACGSSRRLPRPRLPPACSFFVSDYRTRIIEPELSNMRSATAGVCGSSRRTPGQDCFPHAVFFSGEKKGSAFGTTSLSPSGPSAPRTWCSKVRKSLFLRREAPRPWTHPALRRLGRGAPWSANPYFFVGRHHVPEPIRACGASDVVLQGPKSLFLRREAPRPCVRPNLPRTGRATPVI